ncbi:MAG: tRNA 2-thiouridine(34) synthase MnmA [Oscillospiraceae bacterium]|nr:tRNA 2-thiouridine(34) synthase MnmA [Oscillospiraceae bacterium]
MVINMSNKKKLLLAMSGGVDSSVALILLKDKFNVCGVTMIVSDDNKAATDAEKIAGSFGILHYAFDLKEEFTQTVVETFIKTYENGETPNPCVVCNKHIKFGSFFETAASALDCNMMATGHYARVEYDSGSGRFLLKKAVSDNKINAKDQTYVLYTLSQEQLSRVIFPLGILSKEQVRQIAAENNLINSNQPDSQDICFIPDGDYAGFIRAYTGKAFKSGDITDKNGNVLGQHSGLIHYTIGQRKGLGLSTPKPLYVTGKDAALNLVTAGESAELFSNSLTAHNLNWIAFPELKSTLRLYAKTRYSQPEQPCLVSPVDGKKVKVVFDSPQRAITPGQSVVFYDNDTVVGGGVIAVDN